MNKERLKILRDALIEHAKNPGNLKFDLNNWATVKAAYIGENFVDVVRRARLGENFCGTTACAMGVAASLPEFNLKGLGLRGSGSCAGVMFEVNGRDYFGFDAAEKFFGLNFDDADELFSPEKYVGRERKNPLAVADKITALLETA